MLPLAEAAYHEAAYHASIVTDLHTTLYIVDRRRHHANKVWIARIMLFSTCSISHVSWGKVRSLTEWRSAPGRHGCLLSCLLECSWYPSLRMFSFNTAMPTILKTSIFIRQKTAVIKQVRKESTRNIWGSFSHNPGFPKPRLYSYRCLPFILAAVNLTSHGYLYGIPLVQSHMFGYLEQKLLNRSNFKVSAHVLQK
jgi:hypothetical protein